MTDIELASLLLAARNGGPKVPNNAIPADAGQAYRVQRLVMAELGDIGGWKVGAPGPDGPISCAPLPANSFFPARVPINSTIFTQREVESEICFRLGRDLPPRSDPYTHSDMAAALESCHPGIELLQSRLTDPDRANPLALLADFIQSGGFIVGEEIAAFTASLGDPMHQVPARVEQTISNGDVKIATANPAGDMLRLIAWLANEGAVWAGGLRAGQIVTCGSWTGKTFVPAGGWVTTAYAGAERLQVAFT